MTASGTFASGREFADFVDLSRLGAIVTKGVSARAWAGNASPRIAETASGMLNSIGLQNPGVDVFVERDLAWLAKHAPGVPVIVNVSGHSIADYVAVVERLERERGVAAYEINISCPNVDAGGMAFGTTCAAAADVVAAVRPATKRPLIVKLSPNVTDIAEIATIGGGRGGRRRVADQHAARHGDRHRHVSRPSSRVSWAACRVPRSSRSPCGWSGRSPRPSRYPSWEWEGS